jgi:hypothetical protein
MDLQSLLQLTGLTKLGVAGSCWDDSAAEAVLARMTGGWLLLLTFDSVKPLQCH